MKKKSFLILILSYIYISGCCSVPTALSLSQLYSFTKETKKIKGGLGKKVVLIKDFRENEAYDEDILTLKEEIEKYISTHTDLSETTKNNLRELKLTERATKEEVRLLLGEPDRIIKAGIKTYSATEIWIYRINKINTFTIIVIPVFFANEGYYLYFKDSGLIAIERHYLRQTFRSSGVGIYEQKSE